MSDMVSLSQILVSPRVLYWWIPALPWEWLCPLCCRVFPDAEGERVAECRDIDKCRTFVWACKRCQSKPAKDPNLRNTHK